MLRWHSRDCCVSSPQHLARHRFSLASDWLEYVEPRAQSTVGIRPCRRRPSYWRSFEPSSWPGSGSGLGHVPRSCKRHRILNEPLLLCLASSMTDAASRSAVVVARLPGVAKMYLSQPARPFTALSEALGVTGCCWSQRSLASVLDRFREVRGCQEFAARQVRPP